MTAGTVKVCCMDMYAKRFARNLFSMEYQQDM